MGRLPIKAWTSVAILTTALASTPAYAADGVGVCGTIRLAETAVAMLDNQPIVKVFANSATVFLLLDTGAEATVLTPAAAQRIGAQQARVMGRQMYGITGDIPAGELELRSFTIGGVEVPRKRVRVAPIEIVNALSGPLDGVLGADTLSSFDIDLDVPGRRMTLYQEQSCAIASPAWAQPYARIAAGGSPSNRLYFSVQLDGRRISALFDTGAQFSVLSGDRFSRFAAGLDFVWITAALPDASHLKVLLHNLPSHRTDRSPNDLLDLILRPRARGPTKRIPIRNGANTNLVRRPIDDDGWAADPRVLDNAPIAMLLAILPANLAAQEHDGRQLSAHWRP
jgi:Aspartyl protease